MVDAVLFDLFGVIARLQSAAGRERLVRTAGVPSSAFWTAYWARRPGYDRGEVTGHGYWRAVASTLDTTFDDHRVAGLIAADIASWKGVDEEMVALVGQVAAGGRRIALLSNIPEELATHYEGEHRWLDHFEVRAFSCRTGHAKPDPDAYRWCCRALGLTPDRVLFIDDRPENVEAAVAVGLRGHLFTTPAATRRIILELDG